MPELHKLTPLLSILQSRGRRVALVTDGRMSGASGKIPAAIHLSPEALAGGGIARVRDGDVIRLDAINGTLDVLVPEADFAARPLATLSDEARAVNEHDLGRELFAGFRRSVSSAEHGALTWGD
jgi:phosphogluconate dehydratase